MGTHFLGSVVRTNLVLFAVAILASPALAQRARITGTIWDNDGVPIPGATVSLTNPERGQTMPDQLSDELGKYSMLGMQTGTWTLNVQKDGYHPTAGQVRVRLTNPPYDVTLERIPNQLELQLGREALEGLDSEAVQAEITEANAYLTGQQWDQAVTVYRSILEKLPMMHDMRMRLGGALRQLEQYDEAIASFEQVLAEDPRQKSQAEAEIGRTRMLMGDFEAAGDALADIAGSTSASREDLYNLGELEFARGDIDAAAVWYEKATGIDPNWGKPLFKLALVALNKGDIEAAKQLFTQVVERDPNSPEGAQAKATLDALP